MQIETDLGDGTRALSASIELELGARGMLVVLDGLLRVDACPMGDTLRVVTRALGQAEVAIEGEGRGGPSLLIGEHFERLQALRPFRTDMALSLRDGQRAYRVELLIAAMQAPGRGATLLTAQALVHAV